MKAEALFSLSFIAQLNKRVDLAIQHLHTVLELDTALWPSTSFPLTQQDVWFEIGAVCRDNDKENEEKEAFLKSERNPDDPNSWHLHGELLVKIKQYRQAQKALLHAIEMSTTPAPPLWYSLGTLHQKTFNYKDSCNAFMRYANLAGEEIGEQKEKVELLEGSILEAGNVDYALRKELEGLKTLQAAAQQETHALREAKDRFDHQIKAAETQKSKQDGTLNETIQKLKAYEREIRRITIDKDKADRRRGEMEEQVKRSDMRAAGYRHELEDQKSLETSLKQKNSALAKEIKSLKQQLELASPGGSMDPVKLTVDLQQTTEKLNDAKEKLADTTHRLKEFREENSRIKDLMQGAETREAHKDMLLGKASSKIEKLTGTVRNLQTKSYEQLMSEKADLEKKAQIAIEQSKKSREEIKKLSETNYQTQTQSEMREETLQQEVATLKKLRAEQTRELKNLKERNSSLADQLATHRSAAEELRDAHGEVSQRHDEIELERTLLDNELRKATNKLTKLEENEAASESRALLVVSINNLLNRLQKTLNSAEREEMLAITALKQSKDEANSPSKNPDWKIHTMTDSDRALFKLMMMDDVDGLAHQIKQVGTEQMNALNSRGKSLLTVATEKERHGCAKWLESQGAKRIDLEYERTHPGLVDGATQYEDLPPAPASLADLLLEEIWDPRRIIDLLQNMEERLDQTVSKTEHLLTQHKQTEVELRQELARTHDTIQTLQSSLDSSRETAKTSVKQLVDGSRLKTKGLESEIEKRRFSEWQLRAQLQDMQKRCNEALGLQRVEMVEHAKHKMTELVLDQLMEDTSRNPTLAGELSTRKRSATQRARTADSSMLHAAIPTLRAAASTPSSPPEGSAEPVTLNTYANVEAVDPASTVYSHRRTTGSSMSGSARPGNDSAVVDDIIAEIHNMKMQQEHAEFQRSYGRPLSNAEIGASSCSAVWMRQCQSLYEFC
jgi:hypothetical protein